MDRTGHTDATNAPRGESISDTGLQNRDLWDVSRAYAPETLPGTKIVVTGWGKTLHRVTPLDATVTRATLRADGALLELDGGADGRGRPMRMAIKLPPHVIKALATLLELGELCECGHALAPGHQTPGTECVVCMGTEKPCGSFRPVSKS